MPYAERLTVPLRWWVQGTMLIATFWLAVVVAMPPAAAWVVSGIALAVLTGGLLWYGAPRVVVDGGEFRAGRAHIPTTLIGRVEQLGHHDTRRVMGPDADARAYLCTRPYLKRSVKVEIIDPVDPAPYWLVSTRHPDRLAAALRAGLDDTPRGEGPVAG